MFWLVHKTKNLRVPLRLDHIYQITRPAKQAIALGENSTAILLKDDKSISRKHAKITISHNQMLKKIEITVQDESKYSSKIRLNPEESWRKVISADGPDKTSYDSSKRVYFGIKFGVYASEFTITGKLPVFFSPLKIDTPRLPQFIAAKELSILAESEESPETYEYLLYQEKEDDLGALLPRLKNVPIVNVSYFSALKDFLALPGHTEYSSAVQELKIEDFYVSRASILGRGGILVEDSFDGEDDEIAPPSETLADDSFSEPSTSQRITRLTRQSRNRHETLEYSSSVPETEFNLTRKPIDNKSGTIRDWKPTTSTGSPPRQSTQKDFHRSRRLSPLPDIAYSAIREHSQSPDRPSPIEIADDLEEQVQEESVALPYPQDSPAPPRPSYYDDDNDDVLSNPSVMPTRAIQKRQREDIFASMKREPEKTREVPEIPSFNFKRQNSVESGNSPKRVKMDLQIDNDISNTISISSTISSNDNTTSNICKEDISLYEIFPGLDIFTNGSFLSEDKLLEPDENNCWFLTEEKETFTKLAEDYKPPNEIPLLFFNPKTEEFTEEAPPTQLQVSQMPPSQKPKTDSKKKDKTSTQTQKKEKADKKEKTKKPAKKKAGEKFYSQVDMLSFLTRK